MTFTYCLSAADRSWSLLSGLTPMLSNILIIKTCYNKIIKLVYKIYKTGASECMEQDLVFRLRHLGRV